MSSNLASRIENYIKKLLAQSQSGVIELQRNELAAYFQCVPSQINYVLATRFSSKQGYLVESRRGGGGYLKVIKLSLENGPGIKHILNNSLGEQVTQQSAERLIVRLYEEGVLTAREAILITAALNRDTLRLPVPQRDVLRARILKGILLALVRDDFPDR